MPNTLLKAPLLWATGRADYFGAVVNRAARIASHSKTQELRLGVPKSELEDFEPPETKHVRVRYIGTEVFKGVNIEMALFACEPIPYKRMEGNKSSRSLSLMDDHSEVYK